MFFTTILATQQQPTSTANKPNYSFEVPLVIVVLLAVVISKARGGSVNSEPEKSVSYTSSYTASLPYQYQESGENVLPTQNYEYSEAVEGGTGEMQTTSNAAGTDLVKDLARKLGRNIIYGAPGTGKDFFLSHVYRAIKEVHGDKATLFILDCKCDPKELGYFKGVVDPKRLYRKAVSESDAKDVFRWIRDSLEQYDGFDAGTGFKVLVINELAACNSKLSILPKDKELGTAPIKWWIDKLSGYGSSGDSKGVSLFFASQNGHNEGIKFDGGSKSLFTPFLIASRKEMTPTKLILQAQIIPEDKKIGSEAMEVLCDKSPVQRCLYHGVLNKWLPMPELVNFSGYDRDKREFIQRPGQTDALTDNERKELSARTQTVASKQEQIIIKKLEATNAKTIYQFILEDLKVDVEKLEEVHNAILSTLTTEGREDLLSKFPVIEPNGEFQRWHQDLNRRPTPAEIKQQWLKLTGKQLNDRGVTMLLESLGYKD